MFMIVRQMSQIQEQKEFRKLVIVIDTMMN